MKKCVEFVELISAYADGELSDHEKERCEAHLETCENCSALLDLYRGISTAVIDSCVPAPEALCRGVMEKILQGGATVTTVKSSAVATVTAINAKAAGESITTVKSSATGTAANAGKREVIRLVLTRYVPVAACLAIVLLALPRIIDTNRNNPPPMFGMSDVLSSSMPAQNDDSGDMLYPAPDALDPGDGEIMAGGGSSHRSADDPEYQYNGAPESVTSGGSYQEARDSDDSNEKGKSPEPAPSSPAEPEAPPNISDEPVYTDLVGTDGTGGTAEEPPVIGGAAKEPPAVFNKVPAYFDSAYAWIAIYGELPEIMLPYDPVFIEGWADWDTWYAIPRSVAQELMKETSPLYKIESYIMSIDSDWAAVYYTPNR